jgi:hypothetical protein
MSFRWLAFESAAGDGLGERRDFMRVISGGTKIKKWLEEREKRELTGHKSVMKRLRGEGGWRTQTSWFLHSRGSPLCGPLNGRRALTTDLCLRCDVDR